MGVFPAGQMDFLDLIGPALVSVAGRFLISWAEFH
jgi:hypothetical protein